MDLEELRDALDTLEQHGVYTGVKDSYRMVVDAARLVANRQPIPWCITHDRPAKFDKGELVGQGVKVCVISTGGSDHRWWLDPTEDE